MFLSDRDCFFVRTYVYVDLDVDVYIHIYVCGGLRAPTPPAIPQVVDYTPSSPVDWIILKLTAFVINSLKILVWGI